MSRGGLCRRRMVPGFPRVSGDEPGLVRAQEARAVFPRVSGDEPGHGYRGASPPLFSPRERG